MSLDHPSPSAHPYIGSAWWCGVCCLMCLPQRLNWLATRVFPSVFFRLSCEALHLSLPTLRRQKVAEPERVKEPSEISCSLADSPEPFLPLMAEASGADLAP